MIGDLDDDRRTLDQRFPGRTRAVRGHITSDLVYRRGHDYQLEGEVQDLDQPDFTVFKTSPPPVPTSTPTTPGRTIVRGNTP
ncbi:hypothetical protein ACIG5E_38575 [Kitasatospora sp. NPDC053057]|uniref:hypothetical protein n=1 Tax=Kitasatospora sp. NPDC053057 TaxID=3364062 RepID=UPI0037C89E7D